MVNEKRLEGERIDAFPLEKTELHRERLYTVGRCWLKVDRAATIIEQRRNRITEFRFRYDQTGIRISEMFVRYTFLNCFFKHV